MIVTHTFTRFANEAIRNLPSGGNKPQYRYRKNSWGNHFPLVWRIHSPRTCKTHSTLSGLEFAGLQILTLVSVIYWRDYQRETRVLRQTRLGFQALRSLTEDTESTYATDNNDVPSLNEGIKSTAKHLETSYSLLEDEARAWDEGVAEDLKRQRDCLVSVRDMFDRRDRYARNNIPQLERRIESNENKLANLRAKPEGTVRPGEQEKVEQAILSVGGLIKEAGELELIIH